MPRPENSPIRRRSRGPPLVAGVLVAAATLSAAALTTARAPPARASGWDELIASYYPLQAGTSWWYRSPAGRTARITLLPKTKRVQGLETWVFKDTRDGSKQYQACDEQGLRLVKVGGNRVKIPRLGVRRVSLEFEPPIVLCGPDVDLDAGYPQRFDSSGRVTLTVAGYGRARTSYSAAFTVQRGGPIQVPAFDDPFACVDVSGYVSFEGESIFLDHQFAPGVGIATTAADGDQWVLTATDIGQHALSIDSVSTGRAVKLTAKTPTRTAKVSVRVRNRGTRTEVITGPEMLDAFLEAPIESLGACPAPPDARHDSDRFPIVLKPGRRKTFRLLTDVSCANDPEKSTKKDPGHDDCIVHVTVDPTALDVFERSDLSPDPVPPLEVATPLDVLQK